LINPDLNLQM